MKAVDKFVRARKAVKADRSTEQGIAGHQAASKALGNAAGWGRMDLYSGTELAVTDPKSLAGSLIEGLDTPYKRSFAPGEGHINVKEEEN